MRPDHNTLSPEAAGPIPRSPVIPRFIPRPRRPTFKHGPLQFLPGPGRQCLFLPLQHHHGHGHGPGGSGRGHPDADAKCLEPEPNASVRLSGFQSLINEINAPGKHYTLNTADNLWLQAGFSILPSYLNTIQTYYAAGVTNWTLWLTRRQPCRPSTGCFPGNAGYISNLLSPASINSGTKLVLTNAIYFKGTWANQFPVSQTVQQTFNLTTSTSEPVSMMKVTYPGVVGNYNGAASVLAIPTRTTRLPCTCSFRPRGMAALEKPDDRKQHQHLAGGQCVQPDHLGRFRPVALSLPNSPSLLLMT